MMQMLGSALPLLMLVGGAALTQNETLRCATQRVASSACCAGGAGWLIREMAGQLPEPARRPG